MRVLLVLLMLCGAIAHGQTIDLVGPPLARVRQVIAEHTFSLALTITNGPGGPRDYVGLFRVADGVRVDWKYLDDTKDTAKHKAMTSGQTAGTVRFAGLRPGDYAARFYRNGSAAQADLIGSTLVSVPRETLEMVLRESDTVRTITRQAAGAGRERVHIVHVDGREMIVELNAGASLAVKKAKSVEP